MARSIPSDLTRLALAGAHGPEIATPAQPRDALPEDYTAFHGVHWTRQYRGHTLYGEFDFAVLNRAGQMLCIEQKNGPLAEFQGKLFKTDGDTLKSVEAQILRTLAGVRDRIARQLGPPSGPGSSPAIEHRIYCPDDALRRLAAAGLDQEGAVDAPRRDRLAARIQTILPARTPESGGWGERIATLFRQTFEVVPDVHAHIDAQERGYTRVSQGLTEVLDNIERPRSGQRTGARQGAGELQHPVASGAHARGCRQLRALPEDRRRSRGHGPPAGGARSQRLGGGASVHLARSRRQR